MTRIGLLSDTHGYLDDPVLNFFSGCDEIWHAGDLGDLGIMDRLAENRIFRGVHGNIDGWNIVRELPLFQEFTIEEVSVLITHIGFQSGRFTQAVAERLNSFKPKVFVCGHSHILKVKYDESRQMLQINPGAAGLQGIHQVRTAVRFNVNGERISDLEVLELPRKANP